MLNEGIEEYHAPNIFTYTPLEYYMLQYEDLYHELNPHLFLESRRKPSLHTDIPVKVGYRTRANIPTERNTMFANLSRVFGFSPLILEDSSYTYPVQTLTGEGDFINVSYHWSTEYYHFLTEALPAALFCASRVPPGTPIVCGKSSFAEGMFRWFGVTNPIELRDEVGGITAKYIECGNPSHDSIQLLRDRIESRLSFTRTRGILIRRHDKRALENESEILNTFRSLYPDLEWVIFDSLPPEETANLFSSAAVIVGPHGAGFTNMLFSARGITIYEFMPVSQPNVCYTHLSSILGNTYIMIPTQARPPLFSMKPSLREMYLANNMGQIQARHPFGQWIETYAKNIAFQRYLEIGSWNGKGSTICMALGLLNRNDGALLHSLEINQERFVESSTFWAHNPRIRMHHARILQSLPNVRSIHSNIVDQWQKEDEDHFQSASYFDPAEFAPEVVLLDGGEYMTYFEYQVLKPYARVFILDDTLVEKCKRIVEELSADPAWKLVASGSDRNGWAIFQTRQ